MVSLNLKSKISPTKINENLIFFGNDPQNRPLEILIFEDEKRPSSQYLQKKWKDRQANRRVPLLVICIFNEKVYICGPGGEKPPVYNDLDIEQIERICNSALEEPNRVSASLVLTSFLPSLADNLPGIRNEGFLSSNELKYGIKNFKDWDQACNKGKEVLRKGNKKLIESLGFDTDKRDNFTNFLRFKDQKRALGILLDRGTSPDISNPDFANQSPASNGLAIAAQENLPYLIIKTGSLIRIYPVDSNVGIGKRGRTETFIEIDTNVVSNEYAGLLWLIFSGKALKKNGSLNDLIKSSQRYGASLAIGLRKRVYNEVIPTLANGVLSSQKIKNPSKDELDKIFEISLTILFRLLFIAYAEDRDLLPYKTNQEYKRNSLQSITDAMLSGLDFNSLSASDSYWQQINQLFKAVNDGNSSWSVPKYNGGLFSSNKESMIGYEISNLSISNNYLIPSLKGLLTADTEYGFVAVDFRSLSVREFGSIYEGLLESEFIFANEDLIVDKKGMYVVAKDNEQAEVFKNEIYIQNSSGMRKESASYYTEQFLVDDILENSLVPALDNHFKKLNALSDHDAGKKFFDIKVADIAMGSGHFLISAVDKIEEELEIYRNNRLLPEVTIELEKLRTSAKQILNEYGQEAYFEDGQLLRRLIAKRCIYGVDINSMAVELSRLAMWIHTFVPGLPLSFLDRNLVNGDSLNGVGTFDELEEIISSANNDEVQQNLFALDANSILGDARAPLKRLALLSDSTIDDIKRSKDAWNNAQDAVKPAKALFDIIAGSRIKDSDFPLAVLDNWGESAEKLHDSKFRSDAIEGINVKKFVHFPTTFPEVFLREDPGFDLIIGNPPWQELMVDEDGFWCLYYPGLRGMNQKDKSDMIERLKRENPDLEAKYRQSVEDISTTRKALLNGPFKGMGDGDADLYKAFGWRFLQLTQKNGFVGVVLPRDALIAKGSTHFRKNVITHKKVEFTILNNTGKWVFSDIDSRQTISLVIISKGISDNNKIYIKGPFNSKKIFQDSKFIKGSKFLSSDVLKWNESVSLPIFHSADSITVFEKMRKFEDLGSDVMDSWLVRPYSEFHATNDGPKKNKVFELDYDSCPEEYWPVFKGSSFNIWEPDTKEYFGGADSKLALNVIQQKRKRGSSFIEFDRSILEDVNTIPALYPRIAFRQVTNRTNSRTIVTALVPPKVFLTNAAPYFLWPRGSEKDQAYLLGVLSSVVFDWYARLFIEKNVNLFLINCLPVPRLDSENPFYKKLVELSGRLASVDERYSAWAKKVGVAYGYLEEDEKNQMMHELDAVVAHLYKLSENDVEHIFETFHKGWQFESRLEATMKFYKKLEMPK